MTDTECDSGPGGVYDPVGELAPGSYYQVVGIDDDVSWIDDDVTWLQIDPTASLDSGLLVGAVNELSPQPDPPGSHWSLRCWVPSSNVDLSGDPSAVPVVQMPFIQLLEPATCRPGAAEEHDVEQSLEAGGFFRVLGIGDEVIQVDDDVTWSQIAGEPTWIEVDDDITWFRIDPAAVIDPDTPMLPPVEAGEMQPRCWVPGSGVEIRGDLTQVPLIRKVAVMISVEGPPRERYRSPVEVEAVCDEIWGDLAAVRISRTPAVPDDPTLTVDGEPFDLCHAPEADVMQCLALPGDVGSAHTVRTCYPGEACEEWTVAVPACPEPVVREVAPVCSRAFEGHAAVQISGSPDSIAEVRVAVNGERTGLCHALDLGVKECLPLPGATGSWKMVTTCLDGEGCQSWPLTVPDCSSEPEISYSISSTCYYSPAPYQAVNFTYDGTDARLALARADGADLICTGSVGRYSCHHIPGEPGTEVNITFCLARGGCFNERLTARDCGAGRTASTPWQILGTGCHDRERIYFILQTDLNWLDPREDFAYSAYDGVTRYTCEVHPTTVGRLYCSGARPGSPGQLHVCVQQGSSPRACNTFLNWRSTVAGIRSCAPTSVPQEGDACAAWSANANVCLGHPGCAWDNTPPGRCYTP